MAAAASLARSRTQPSDADQPSVAGASRRGARRPPRAAPRDGAGSGKSRNFVAACMPARRAAPGARARHRSRPGQGHRREGPHHQGRRRRLAQSARLRRAGGWCRRAVAAGIPEIPAAGLLQVRPDRDASRWRASRRSPARTCIAPGSTSPTSPTTTRRTSPRSRAYRKELDDAAKDKGYRVTLLAFLMKASVVGAEGVPGVQRFAEPEKDALILKQILPHRRRRRHAGRAWSCR